jgi:2-(1,2-epoxy-1,2-dihydrophenyl)acetyl-CoA isomerase
MKMGFQKVAQMNLEEALSAEADWQSEAGRTEDFAEGVMSFIQKRSPKFKGK